MLKTGGYHMASNILIVDDSAVTRAVLKKTVEMTGLPVNAVFQASNGAEAIRQIQHQPIHLILADLNMPELSGVEMAEKLFDDPKYRDIPLVIITTEASTTRIDQLKLKGIKGYIHKPFTPETVRSMLQQFLETCHA